MHVSLQPGLVRKIRTFDMMLYVKVHSIDLLRMGYELRRRLEILVVRSGVLVVRSGELVVGSGELKWLVLEEDEAIVRHTYI